MGHVLTFLDEEEALAPQGGGEPPSRRTPDRNRQIMLRRAVGLGAVVLLLILIVLGIKGCLNARKTRSFENYASDLTAIVSQSNQLSHDFFGRLTNPGNLSPLSFKAEIASDRGTAAELDARVHSLDTPDELKAAQNQLDLAFDLRRDGLSGIADQISSALGTAGRTEAIDSIANYMRYFLASDVLYARAQSEINSVLHDEGIDQKVPASAFLPEPVTDWLDPLKISTHLATVAGTKQATSGTHGLGLLQTTIKPGNVTLDPSTPATISTSGPYQVDVQVQNQGDSEESNVGVTLQLTGGTQTISGDATIKSIAPGAIQTATISLEPTPASGQATLEVTVQPVLGEQVESNNRSTYQLTFP
jgi:hypothetical protein